MDDIAWLPWLELPCSHPFVLVNSLPLPQRSIFRTYEHHEDCVLLIWNMNFDYVHSFDSIASSVWIHVNYLAKFNKMVPPELQTSTTTKFLWKSILTAMNRPLKDPVTVLFPITIFWPGNGTSYTSTILNVIYTGTNCLKWILTMEVRTNQRLQIHLKSIAVWR